MSPSAIDHQAWDETDTIHPIPGFPLFILVLMVYPSIRKENMSKNIEDVISLSDWMVLLILLDFSQKAPECKFHFYH